MHLSKRLLRVAANVMSDGVVADIGCDHGFTSIYLIAHKKATKAIAMDINAGPLKRAREHVAQYDMQDKITLRLSDGAEQLKHGEADTLLISGMGGALICNILQEGKDVTQSAKELVLSPQSEVFLVLRCIHQLGFRIEHEEMVLDQGKYYVVIRAVKGQEIYQQEEDYLYGRRLIEEKNPVFISFLLKEEARVLRILGGMEKKKLSPSAVTQKQNLERELTQLRGVQNRMVTVHSQAGEQ